MPIIEAEVLSTNAVDTTIQDIYKGDKGDKGDTGEPGMGFVSFIIENGDLYSLTGYNSDLSFEYNSSNGNLYLVQEA